MSKGRTINLDKPEDEDLAEMFINPITSNAITSGRFIKSFAGDSYLTEGRILKFHIDTKKEIKKGDLSTLEAMLTSQSLLLNHIFSEAANRAADNMNDYPKISQTFMNMALKAQSQCRCTVEAINEIKNPKSVTITKQANIADQQIVNNGNMNTSSRAEKKADESNELLEQINSESLDNAKINAKEDFIKK